MPNIEPITLGRITLLLLVTAVLLLTAYGFMTPTDPGRVWLRRYRGELKVRMDFLRLSAKPEKVLVVQSAVCFVMCVLSLLLRRWEPAVLSCVVIPAPWIWLESKVSKRITAIESQTDIWLGALANALRASPSLGEAISSTIAVTEVPLCQELETLMKDYELGTPLDEALANLGRRCRSPVMDASLQALRVARKTGGNLTDTLESAAAALRELARLEGVVRTKTAEGKTQAMVIGCVPFALASIISWVDPVFLSPLWDTVFGNILVVIAGIIWAVAVLLAKKICAVDV
jgi:tight adherence protein B